MLILVTGGARRGETSQTAWCPQREKPPRRGARRRFTAGFVSRDLANRG